MTSHDDLEHALKEMMRLIETKAEGAQLVAQLTHLDQLAEGLGPETPPMLRHYMGKRGYPKALEFLAGLDERKKPNC